MIKFVIEVEESYIDKFADADQIQEEQKKGRSMFSLMLDILSFCSIKSRIEKGETEFTINPHTDKEVFVKTYKEVVSTAAAAFLIQDAESKKGKEDKCDNLN